MTERVLLLLNALGYECVLSRDKLDNGSKAVIMLYGPCFKETYKGFVEITKKDKIMWTSLKKRLHGDGKPVHVLRLRDLPEALENL